MAEIAFDSADHDQLYLLGRSSASSIRLVAQHHVLTARQGWLLHPTIEKAIANRDKLEILDMATGSGAWAFDIARKYPNAVVTGLDNSTDQYPPAWTMHDTMDFGLYNLFDEVPENLVGKFDVVHLRFMHITAPALDLDMLLEKLKKLVRPGGWLQYVEVYGEVTSLVDENMQAKSGRPHLLYEHARAIELPWAMSDPISNLDDMFRAHGFLEVDKFVPPFKRRLMKIETDNMILSSAEFLNTSRDKIGEGALLDHLYEDLANMEKDAKNGVMFGMDYLIAIGQKPEE